MRLWWYDFRCVVAAWVAWVLASGCSLTPSKVSVFSCSHPFFNQLAHVRVIFLWCQWLWVKYFLVDFTQGRSLCLHWTRHTCPKTGGPSFPASLLIYFLSEFCYQFSNFSLILEPFYRVPLCGIFLFCFVRHCITRNKRVPQFVMYRCVLIFFWVLYYMGENTPNITDVVVHVLRLKEQPECSPLCGPIRLWTTHADRWLEKN